MEQLPQDVKDAHAVVVREWLQGMRFALERSWEEIDEGTALVKPNRHEDELLKRRAFHQN